MRSSQSLLVPRTPLQPGVVPFADWSRRYAYYVDCVLENLRTALEGGAALVGSRFDWRGMRRDLERYLYETGHSRFKSFRPATGPHPARHPRWEAEEDAASAV